MQLVAFSDYYYTEIGLRDRPRFRFVRDSSFRIKIPPPKRTEGEKINSKISDGRNTRSVHMYFRVFQPMSRPMNRLPFFANVSIHLGIGERICENHESDAVNGRRPRGAATCLSKVRTVTLVGSHKRASVYIVKCSQLDET